MHYIVWVTMSSFYSHRYSEPTVVYQGDHVLEATSELLERGIHRGLPLKQARALVGSARFVEFKPSEYLDESQKWMNVLIAYTDLIQTDGLEAAWIELCMHPDPESVLRLLLADLSHRFPYHIGFGLGPSRWIARIAANYSHTKVSLTHPAQYLSSHPIIEIPFLDSQLIERLQFLGYRTFGELQQLPKHVLLKQFGHHAELILQAAFGRHDEPVVTNYPEQSASSKIVFEAPLTTLEQLHAALDRIAHSLLKQLAEETLFAYRLRLILETQENHFESFERTFHQPLYSIQSLKTALRLMFLNSSFLEIHSIKVVLPELKSRKESQQSFYTAQRLEVHSALDTIRVAYGRESVRMASELKPSWKQSFLKQWMASLGNS
jgi:DNA polymerase IV